MTLCFVSISISDIANSVLTIRYELLLQNQHLKLDIFINSMVLFMFVHSLTFLKHKNDKDSQ